MSYQRAKTNEDKEIPLIHLSAKANVFLREV